MEHIGQTKKWQKDEGKNQGKRKRSGRSGGDTLEYLREKCKMEKTSRERE